jgi:hypothetical protein
MLRGVGDDLFPLLPCQRPVGTLASFEVLTDWRHWGAATLPKPDALAPLAGLKQQKLAPLAPLGSGSGGGLPPLRGGAASLAPLDAAPTLPTASLESRRSEQQVHSGSFGVKSPRARVGSCAEMNPCTPPALSRRACSAQNGIYSLLEGLGLTTVVWSRFPNKCH